MIKRKKFLSSFILVSFSLVFSVFMIFIQGCANFNPSPRSLEPGGIPQSYRVDSRIFPHEPPVFSISTAVPCRWWEDFGSEMLNHLVEQALDKNFSIRGALARLEQARAATASSRASLFPLISVDGSFSRRQKDDSNTSLNIFSMGPAASYEIDLWGRIKTDIKTSNFQEKASELDMETAAMSLAAEVAGTWIDLISTGEKLSLITKQVEINTMVLDLLEFRFEKSMSSALDVLQQREVVERAKARIPPLEIKMVQLKNALGLLLGGTPENFVFECNESLRDIPPLPNAGIPADLLENRPDIRAARYRLIAADWSVAGARVQRLPSLTLTGSLLFQDSSLDEILKNWILSLTTALTGVVFDGGKRKAAVDQAIGVVKERLALYEETVFTAIMEVENSIASEMYRNKWIALLKGELDAANLALEEAKRRYIKGLDPFIPFLTEQLNVQDLEISLIDQRTALFQDRISLHRSMGGSFEEFLHDYHEGLPPQSKR